MAAGFAIRHCRSRNSTAAMSDRIDRTNGHFRLELSDGARLSAHRVVVAAGIMPFAFVPAPFQGLSPELVSHSSQQRDLGSSTAGG